MRDSTVLINLLKRQKNEGKLYGAICAAPSLVLHTHHLLLSPATGYPGFTFEGGESIEYKSTERVVVTKNCITSQGPGTAMEMALKIVEILNGQDKADDVAQGLLHH